MLLSALVKNYANHPDKMAAEITKRVQGTPQQKKLDVLLGDVIKTTLPAVDVCISNTPYQVRFGRSAERLGRLQKY